MILVRRHVLLLLLAAACGGNVALGVRGYLLLRAGAGAQAAELRMQAESLLFLAIVFTVLMLVFGAAVALRSRNIGAELDKIADIARQGSFSFEGSLGRLGPLGHRIQRLNQSLADTNEQKTLRISAMAGINAFLVTNIRLPLLVTDITGKVTAVSPRAAEKLGGKRGEMTGRFIKDVVGGVDFQAVVFRLEKEHVEVTEGPEREAVTYYPVFNRNNQLSNVICVIAGEEAVSVAARRGNERPAGAAASVSRVASFVRRALRSRARG